MWSGGPFDQTNLSTLIVSMSEKVIHDALRFWCFSMVVLLHAHHLLSQSVASFGARLVFGLLQLRHLLLYSSPRFGQIFDLIHQMLMSSVLLLLRFELFEQKWLNSILFPLTCL